MNTNDRWGFRPLRLEDYRLVDSYFTRLGEGSCQHSFAALYAYQHKYQTEICEWNNCLYVRQLARNEGMYESYLMPMAGDKSERAVEVLMETLQSHGKRLKLQTITESAKIMLESRFSGRFLLEEDRDASEYLYRTEKLACLEGAELSDLRYCYNRFYRNFGERTEVVPVRAEELDELIEFQRYWMEGKRGTSDYPVLEAEHEAIMRICRDFELLGFKGILVRIDGQVRGYALGCGISEYTFDVFFEKGDLQIRDIYRCLVTDMVRIHGLPYRYINREEDLGDAGMRYAKLSYRPDRLMKKYIAREVL